MSEERLNQNMTHKRSFDQLYEDTGSKIDENEGQNGDIFPDDFSGNYQAYYRFRHNVTQSSKDVSKEKNKEIDRNNDFTSNFLHFLNPRDSRIDLLESKWFSNRDCLDIGCNDGLFTSQLTILYECRSMLGVDIDSDLVIEANEKKRKCVKLLKDLVNRSSSSIHPSPSSSSSTLTENHHSTSSSLLYQFPSNIQFVECDVMEELELLKELKLKDKRDEKEEEENGIEKEEEEVSTTNPYLSHHNTEIPTIYKHHNHNSSSFDDSSNNIISILPSSDFSSDFNSFDLNFDFLDQLTTTSQKAHAKEEEKWFQETDIDSRSRRFDTICAFSITKWIHLNHGDEGIILFFWKLKQLLKMKEKNQIEKNLEKKDHDCKIEKKDYDGGIESETIKSTEENSKSYLILEIQPWKSYKKNRHSSTITKTNYQKIKLKPTHFHDILTNGLLISKYDQELQDRIPPLENNQKNENLKEKSAIEEEKKQQEEKKIENDDNPKEVLFWKMIMENGLGFHFEDQLGPQSIQESKGYFRPIFIYSI